MRICVPLVKMMDESWVKRRFAEYFLNGDQILYDKYTKKRFVIDMKQSDSETVILEEYTGFPLHSDDNFWEKLDKIRANKNDFDEISKQIETAFEQVTES